MIETLQEIIRGAVQRLSAQTRTDLPPVIAGLVILLVAYLFARLGRWMVTRIFKGIEVDSWLRRSGVISMFDHAGTLRASRLTAEVVYWGILLVGSLTALNAFGTHLSTRIVEGAVLLFPRALFGGAILLAGMWLGQYLGRSMLVWAVNEDLPSPRRLALGVRILVVFVAVVVAADTLNFARGVFLAAFILILGGTVLTLSLALGLGGREAVRRYFEDRRASRELEADGHADERSLWHHL